MEFVDFFTRLFLLLWSVMFGVIRVFCLIEKMNLFLIMLPDWSCWIGKCLHSHSNSPLSKRDT